MLFVLAVMNSVGDGVVGRLEEGGGEDAGWRGKVGWGGGVVICLDMGGLLKLYEDAVDSNS